jgi:hypothetical protein
MSTLLSASAAAASSWIDVEDKEPVKDYAYSFVVIGDTQIICYKDATKGTNYMETLYDWIVDHKEEKKIEYVFGLGDITDQDWTETGDAEWAVATSAIRKLDGVVPYSVVRGNHDRQNRFHKAFNYDAYRSQFEGFYNEKAVYDTHRTFSVGGDDYLFVTLDHGPDDKRLEWADKVISKYPDHRVIITTHWYTNKEGNPGDVNDYGNAKPIIENHGEQIYNKLVKKHDNIFMVMSGHLNSDGIVVKQKPSPAGNKITNVLFDTQGMDDMSPVGMIAIFYFSEDGKTIDIECFSTAKNQFFKEEYQFSISIPKGFVKTTAESTTATATKPASTTAEVTDAVLTSASTTQAASNNGCKGTISAPIIVSIALSVGTVSSFARRRRRK